MVENLIYALFRKSFEACQNCYMYSKIDLDKRDRYTEHALNALQAIAENNNEDSYSEKLVAQESLEECKECRYESTKIAECILR